jgi:hypothetical protein
MLMNQSSKPSLSFFNLPALCRVSALALFVGASSFAVQAQQVAPQLLASTTDKPLDLAARAGVDYSSSVNDVASPVDPDETVRRAVFADGYQPPPRRRYGRPRYNDNQHNADGSAKWGFDVGVGMTAPVGNTYHYLNTSYGFQVGVARNFNKKFGVLMQFDYDRFGFNGRTLTNQEALYNYCPLGHTCSTPITDLDGNSHIWSFSLDPMYTVFDASPVGAYVIGGVGFYHKVANFTLPQDACADYYCYYQVTENVNVDHYTSNAPGFSGGIGLTYKASKFSSEHLFVEARYVLLLNSQRDGLTASNINTTAGQAYYNSGATDYYPANSNRTTYTAYKAGIRF